MSHLFTHLPAFAPDYSGAASALYPLGGLVVIHEPSGCMGNFTGFDEPRWYHDPRAIYSSFIREEEAVLGDDSILVRKILHECERRRPSFIALLGTPVPALIGTDLKGIATEITELTKIPAFGLETTGFGNYQDGIRMALLALEEQFMNTLSEKRPGTVNILGYTPLDFFLSGDDKAIGSWIRSSGCQVICQLPGDDLESIFHAPEAEMNIVVSASALPLAREMKKMYGIPYYAGLPCGRYGRERMRAFLQKRTIPIRRRDLRPGSVLIIGEQVFASAVRDLLMDEYGLSDLQTATFFSLDPEIAMPDDLKLVDEADLKAVIRDNHYESIIGDPLFARFVQSGQVFIPLPHPAVSSRLHWDSYHSPMDDTFGSYLSGFILKG